MVQDHLMATRQAGRPARHIFASSWPAKLRLAVLAAGLATSAAGAAIGPSSSATVEISLSVAARYELRALPASASRAGGKADAADRYCIGTNGAQADQPVMIALLFEAAREASRGNRATEVQSCGNGNPASALAGAKRPRRGLLLIRPE